MRRLLKRNLAVALACAAATATGGAASSILAPSTQPSPTTSVARTTPMPAVAMLPPVFPTTNPLDDHPLRLWPAEIPDAHGNTNADMPLLFLFRPPHKASGAIVIICPGGGYARYGTREGRPVAQWLNGLGVSAAVLLYRLGSHGYHYPVEYEDVERAIRLVRADAPLWGLDSRRVGIMGFSAGGHLASTAATHFDAGNPASDDIIERQNSRPDLAMLIYPVITMGVFTHSGSRRNLLGDSPDPKLVEFLSNEKQVTPRTPPCFIVHGADDTTVPVTNSIAFALACQENSVPFELHIYEHGRHGFGLGGKDPSLSTWPVEAAHFLARHEFLNPAPPTTAP
jgi:acetyl esterase/lipase